jgi:glycosyltransferase involved in cell wall biosynthesis
LARAEGCTAYLSPKGFLPGQFGRVRHLRSAVVVHDLIPLWYARNFPQQFGKLEQYVVNGGLRRTLRHADDVIAISEATAQEIAFHCGRTAGIHVVHNGLTLHAAGQAPLAGDFILAISSPLPHKNLQGVLTAYRAYRTLTTAPLPLLLTGVTDPHEPGVVASGWLSDPDLHACFGRAKALLFLPLIEGFGFPPLEAMAAGTPVVCSDIPALRETTQGQAALVHPGASLEIARALLQATTETPQRRAWVEAGPRVAREYLWSRCAQSVQQVLAGLLMREHHAAGHAEPLSRPGSEP